MKIPNKLKVGGYTYEVILEDRNDGRGDTHPAVCHMGQHKIWIDIKQCREEQESSLIHEILEVINYHYALNLDHDKRSVLEAVLYQVLKDNHLLKQNA